MPDLEKRDGQQTSGDAWTAEAVAELQAFALAVRMFGLDAIADGRVALSPKGGSNGR